MKLSLNVFKTTHCDEIVYYNSLTGEILPENASPSEFNNKLFLHGQEYDAIKRTLLYDRGIFGLTIIPTWECNLRCTHCSVNTQLKLSDDGEINTEHLQQFISSYLNKFNSKLMSVHFVGGEPLLRSQKCLGIVKMLYAVLSGSGISCIISLTTNGMFEFNETIIELFDHLDIINVSVDGNKTHHNKQRRPLTVVGDQYDIVIANLTRLTNLYGNKINVKASIPDEYYTKDSYEEFLRTIVKCGVHIDNITYGCIHPTDLKHDENKLVTFKKLYTTEPTGVPCCKYRYNHMWLVDSSNKLFDVPYKWAQSKIGELTDSIDELLERRSEIALNSFPCFSDQKCMSCPVLGFCWGQCVNASPLTDNKPSTHCNQANLIKTVQKLSDDGQLVEFILKESHQSKIECNIQ